MQYYIRSLSDEYVGPYDMLSVIRKIRNKKITPETGLIASEEGEESPLYSSVKAAIEYAEFNDIFAEIELETEEFNLDKGVDRKKITIADLVRRGVSFFNNNHMSSMVLSAFILLGIVVSILASFIAYPLLKYALAVVICYFLLSLFQIYILRKARMQVIDFSFFVHIVREHGLQLFLASAIVGLSIFMVPFGLSLIFGEMALLLVIFPGSLIMLLFYFAPMIIVDRGETAFSALGSSAIFVNRLKLDNSVAVYTVLLMNFIAFFLMFLPVLVVLPMVMGALSEIYDEYYSDLL